MICSPYTNLWNLTLSSEPSCSYKLTLVGALDTVRSPDRVSRVGVYLCDEFFDFRR
jgi:hypothetical protein